MVWYALTEYIWGSTATAPKTRSTTKIEDGWVLVRTDKESTTIIKQVETDSPAESPIIKRCTKRKAVREYLPEELQSKELKLSSRARAKLLQDARDPHPSRINQKEANFALGKDGLRQRKRPTARNLKRQELQKSFPAKKGITSKYRQTFQPRRRCH